MQLVHIYLNFAGNTEEAFKFYEKVFGTRILMKMTYGDTLFVKNVPDSAKNKLMHIQLPITEAVHLMTPWRGLARSSSRATTSMSPSLRTTRPRLTACSKRSAATVAR